MVIKKNISEHNSSEIHPQASLKFSNVTNALAPLDINLDGGDK